MRNVDALLAMHRTAHYLRLPERHQLDLTHDTESMIGIHSDMYGDKFGWVLRDNGTHTLNPTYYSYATLCNASFIDRTFGSKESVAFFFWWDGKMLIEVSPEQLDSLLLEEYAVMAALDQWDFHKSQLDKLVCNFDIVMHIQEL